MRLYILLQAILLSVSAIGNASESGKLRLERELSDYISSKDARIGVAVITDSNDTISVNGNWDFPMFSVCKFPQAIAVADYCRRNKINLSDSINVYASDLKEDTWSPLRDKYEAADMQMTLTDLLAYSLQQSDNNACDILFRITGGTVATDSVMKALGCNDITITATEDDMHRDMYLSYLNRATPLDMARLLELFNKTLIHESPEYKSIADIMESCATGTDRLAKPLLPLKAIIRHKTGTGFTNTQGRIMGINDVGYVIMPDGHSYSIAVFVADSAYESTETSQIIAEISQIVATGITELQAP